MTFLSEAAPPASSLNLVLTIAGLIGSGGIGYVIRGVFKFSTQQAIEPIIKKEIAAHMDLMTAQLDTRFARFEGKFKDDLIAGINGTYVRSREDRLRWEASEKSQAERHKEFLDLYKYSHEAQHEAAQKLTAINFMADALKRLEDRWIPDLMARVEGVEGGERRHNTEIAELRKRIG